LVDIHQSYYLNNKCIGDDTKGRKAPLNEAQTTLGKPKNTFCGTPISSHYRNSVIYCFLTQIFTEIGQSVAALWPKTIFNTAAVRHLVLFKLLTDTKHRAVSLRQQGYLFVQIWRLYDLQHGGRPPRWIFEIYILCYVTSIVMLFCFPVQRFIEIGCWVIANNDF